MSDEALSAAVNDYYTAVARQDWSYTYDRQDLRARQRFTKSEWEQKNQWFADNFPLENLSPEVGSDTSSLATVTLTETFKDGTSQSRDTYFVYEDDSWRHQFSQEELKLFLPGSPFAEFVKAQRDRLSGSSTEKTASP